MSELVVGWAAAKESPSALRRLASAGFVSFVDFVGPKWRQVCRATILLQRTPQSRFGCNAIPIGAGSQTRIVSSRDRT